MVDGLKRIGCFLTEYFYFRKVNPNKKEKFNSNPLEKDIKSLLAIYS